MTETSVYTLATIITITDLIGRMKNQKIDAAAAASKLIASQQTSPQGAHFLELVSHIVIGVSTVRRRHKAMVVETLQLFALPLNTRTRRKGVVSRVVYHTLTNVACGWNFRVEAVKDSSHAPPERATRRVRLTHSLIIYEFS